MAATYKAQFLAIMRRLEQQLTAVFGDLATDLVREIARHAGPNGTIPISATFELQRIMGERVTALFFGRNLFGELVPFIELPGGAIRPAAEFPRILRETARAVEDLAVNQQRNVIIRVASSRPEAEALLRLNMPIFRPNPLARYDQLHTWVDANGHTLSDRIWRTAGMTRRKLDLFLDERIRQGQGALDMARDLEVFLQPGRTLRTQAPYGIDASYDAMRLARTEITRAHSRAFERAAEENPFVEQLEVVLSGSHPKPDICDVAAAAGPFPKDAVPTAYQIPMHPHCLCTYRNVMVPDPAAKLDALLANLRRPRMVQPALEAPL